MFVFGRSAAAPQGPQHSLGAPLKFDLFLRVGALSSRPLRIHITSIGLSPVLVQPRESYFAEPILRSYVGCCIGPISYFLHFLFIFNF